MAEYLVRFIQTPGPGVGASDRPLAELRMEQPPNRGDGVYLPGRGLQRWYVDQVDLDLRGARREVVVWVSACD